MNSATTRRAIDDFVSQRKLAVVGVSRSAHKFGYTAFRALRSRGYEVFAVNPQADCIAGERCYRSMAELPEPVGGAVIVVKPRETAGVVEQAAAAGIRRVWMQQGSESEEALRICAERGIEAVAGECILMFAEPRGIHGLHRWLWGVLGKVPA
jgi:predicted CoA-binding protein